MKWLNKIVSVLKKIIGVYPGQPVNQARVLLRLSLLGFSALIAWAYFSEIDKVVHAQGQVIASNRTQTVQTADGGVLTELRVKEGDIVEKGQIVAVLEKARASAAYDDAFGKVSALRMTVIRLQAEVTGHPFNIPADLELRYPEFANVQKTLYKQRRQSRDEQIYQLKVSRRIAQEELDLNRPLAVSGDVSKAEILKLERAVNDIDIQIKNVENKYLQDASAEWNKAREDLNSQEQSLADRGQLLEQTDLLAPEAGIVKNIKVTTIGGVLRQGEEVLQILPTDSDLVVEVKIKPIDMAFMIKGLPARVKLDAYDYSIFGVMDGEINYISPDALSEETKQGAEIFYRARITIGEREFKGKMSEGIEVRPGMTATVDILSGKRSVLSYLTKPLTKTLGEAFSEK
jgi:membrane fusion protein, adhesin transport system